MALEYNAAIAYNASGVRYDGAGSVPPTGGGVGGMGAGGAMLYERDRERYVLRVARRRREDGDVLDLIVLCIDLL